MTKQEEIDVLYGLGTTKKKGWQQSDNPCVASDYGDLEKAWNTMTKGMNEAERGELVDTIKLAIQAQALFRRESRRAGDFVPQPKLIASWIRKKRWRDQITSHAEMAEKSRAKNACNCGQPVIHARMGVCLKCYEKKVPNPMLESLRDVYMRHKIHQLKTPQDHINYQKRMLLGSGIFRNDES